MKLSSWFGKYTALVIVLAPIMTSINAGAASLPEDGTWAGTYACSEGVLTIAGTKAFSFPIKFNVTNRFAANVTNNENMAETATLTFDDRGNAEIELNGQRKADHNKNWLIKAHGAVTGDHVRAEGSMFRRDGKTLIRQNCSYDLQKQPAAITSSATTGRVTSDTVTPTPSKPPPGTAPQLGPDQTRQLQAAQDVEAKRRATELEQQKLRAEVAAAKQRADDAERRNRELRQQLAAATASQTKQAVEGQAPIPVTPGPSPNATAPTLTASAPLTTAPVPAAPASAPSPHMPAAGLIPPPPPVATNAPSPPRPQPQMSEPPSAPEPPKSAAAQEASEEQRLKAMLAALLAKDGVRTPTLSDGQARYSAMDDATLTLSVMQELDALGLKVYLDKRDPLFKRDLSGNATLGDGGSPIRILLLNAATRIQRRSLLQSAALSLGLATDPAKASTDTNTYQQTLGEMLGKLLKDKSIQPAAPPQGGVPRFSVEFVPIDWTENGGQALDRIGQRFPLIVVFNALIDPAENTDIVLYQQKGTPAANLRQRQAYEQAVAKFQARLAEPNFELIGTPSAEDLAALRGDQLQAMNKEGDRLLREMLGRIARIDDAAAKNAELAGALRVYPKGKKLTANPQEVFCAVTAEDALLLKGLAASSDFAAWSSIPVGSPFTEVLQTPDAMYEAIQAQKCGIVIDNAVNLKRYMAAIGRDGQFAYNVGPVVNRQEAQEPFAVALGYQNWAEYQFSEAIGGRTSSEMKTLKSFGITDQAEFTAAVTRMQQSHYATDAADLPEFLADEVEGKKAGQSAKAYRDAENHRLEAEAQEREAVAQRQLADKAKEYPYVAVLTCGMGNQHINILACFAAQGSHSVDTELKLSNGDQFGLYKAYNMSSAGSEQRDGFYIDLREHFSLVAQNSHDTLTLSLKVIDRLSGKVLYQNAGAKFDVLRVSN